MCRQSVVLNQMCLHLDEHVDLVLVRSSAHAVEQLFMFNMFMHSSPLLGWLVLLRKAGQCLLMVILPVPTQASRPPPKHNHIHPYSNHLQHSALPVLLLSSTRLRNMSSHRFPLANSTRHVNAASSAGGSAGRHGGRHDLGKRPAKRPAYATGGGGSAGGSAGGSSLRRSDENGRDDSEDDEDHPVLLLAQRVSARARSLRVAHAQDAFAVSCTRT